MSLIQFELKTEHLLLLKHLNWCLNDKKLIVSTDVDDDRENPIPFMSDTLYEGIDLILNGKPKDFDPLKEDAVREFSKEEKENMDKLYEELPTALDIILYTGKFEVGMYLSRYHLRDWKRTDNACAKSLNK